MKKKKIKWLLAVEACVLAGLIGAAVWLSSGPALLRQPEGTEPPVITTAPTTEAATDPTTAATTVAATEATTVPATEETTVPEPAAATLSLLALVGLAARRRRR